MKLKKTILLITDLIILYVSLAVALTIRYGRFNLETFQNHLFSFTIIYLLWIIVFYIHDLYDLAAAKNDAAFYSALMRSILINAGLAIAFFYFIPQISQVGITPRTNLFITIAIFVILFTLWRNLFNKLAGFKGLNVAIIGTNPQAIELAQEIENNPQLGYRLKLFLKQENEFKNLKNILIAQKIDLAIITPEVYSSLDVIQNLFECLRHKIDFVNLPAFYEQFAKKIPISAINQIWFLENISQNNKGFYEFGKRIFDFISGLLLLIITLPLWVIIAVIIKLEPSGPVFYTQTRIGQNGKAFKLKKFRTMKKDAEKDGPKMAQKNDPRVTKFGRFLRKTRLDELPQLWNIIKGEMSFVGPRAERPEFMEDLKKTIPFYKERYLIKPGLSGWAQIKYGYSSSIGENFEKVQYDLYYVKNRSFLFDLGIILRTINIILRGGGQ